MHDCWPSPTFLHTCCCAGIYYGAIHICGNPSVLQSPSLSLSLPPSLPPSIHFLPHLCQCVYLCVFQHSGPEHTFPFKEKKPRKKCEGVVCEAEHLHVKGKNLRSRGVNSSVIPQDWWQGEGAQVSKGRKVQSHSRWCITAPKYWGGSFGVLDLCQRERDRRKTKYQQKIWFFFSCGCILLMQLWFNAVSCTVRVHCVLIMMG